MSTSVELINKNDQIEDESVVTETQKSAAADISEIVSKPETLHNIKYDIIINWFWNAT